MKTKQIDRREALRKTLLIMGSTLSAPTIMGILDGCSISNETDWAPDFFDKDQAILITEVSEIIIPATDTSGTRDVGVPKFIESMIRDVYSEDDRNMFIEGLTAFNTRAEKSYGKVFTELNPGQKPEFVKKLNDDAIINSDKHDKTLFILTVKELTVGGLCSSEAGTSQVLKYDKVPGAYHGCIPYEEAGKQWAT